MTLEELQEEIGRLLGDPAHDRWPLTTLTTRINEAQTIVQGYTNAYQTTETGTLNTDDESTDLNANTMDITMVTITRPNGDIDRLQGITRFNLDYDYPNNRNTDSGDPIFYFYDQQVLRLWPIPDSTYNGLSIFIREVRKPDDLVDASDIPFNSSNLLIPYHMAIVHWVVSQCWMDDGTPESLAKARFHKTGVLDDKGAGQFELQIKRILAKVNSPEDVPEYIKWKPTGARVGASNYPSKSNPFAGL